MQETQDDWFSDDCATFGDRLAAAREKTGMGRGKFARRLGVKKSTVASWEEDLTEPRANRLQMMAGLLNVSITWLLYGEGEGVSAPDASESPDMKLDDILAEIRDIKTQISQSGDRLARLEKRLRTRMKESSQ